MLTSILIMHVLHLHSFVPLTLYRFEYHFIFNLSFYCPVILLLCKNMSSNPNPTFQSPCSLPQFVFPVAIASTAARVGHTHQTYNR